MKRILFCASTPLSYAMFKPIHRRLKMDPGVEIWFTANHDADTLYRTVGLKNEKIVGKYRSMLMRFDMCVCPSFFYTRKNAPVKVQIFHGCSLKNRAVHKDALAYNKLFLVGPYMKQKFISTWNLKEHDPRFEEIGMPKLDAFFDGSLKKEETLDTLGLDRSLPTVIYAPTRPTPTSSSLTMYGTETIETIAQMPVNLLIKLHDRSFQKWRPKGRIDWEEWLKKYDGHKRVRVIHDYDVVPYLFASDLLVSDISSVVNEFSLLNRPMVLFAVPRLIAFHKKLEARRGVESSDLAEWGQDAGTTVQKPDELQKAIDYCLEHPAEKQELRKKFAQQFFFNPGQATDKALEKIYALLALNPPA